MLNMTHPKIKAFKALRYNEKKAGSLATLVSPPYDVINNDMQQMLYDRNTYNLVRVDLNRGVGNLRYSAAAQNFKDWIANGVLTPDEKPAIYFHHQTFKLPNGSWVTRKGFFAVRRVEDFSEGGIKPHEKTLEGPKTDRLKLTKALQCQLSPVFSLYADPLKKIDTITKSIKEKTADVDFWTRENERHQMWIATDPAVCDAVEFILGSQPLFIADGHHRYETSINYRNELRKIKPPGDGMEHFNYVLMYFSSMNDDGLVILPIHRALHNIPNFNINTLLTQLQAHFDVKPLGSLENVTLLNKLEESGKASHSFALVTKDPKESYLISLLKSKWNDLAISKTVPACLRGLDVTVLHRLVFEEILKISQEAQAKQENIIYWKDTGRAINETRAGACDVSFLLNATRITDMEHVAMDGEKMPQKSTYFYPKILSGLVMHDVS